MVYKIKQQQQQAHFCSVKGPVIEIKRQAVDWGKTCKPWTWQKHLNRIIKMSKTKSKKASQTDTLPPCPLGYTDSRNTQEEALTSSATGGVARIPGRYGTHPSQWQKLKPVLSASVSTDVEKPDHSQMAYGSGKWQHQGCCLTWDVPQKPHVVKSWFPIGRVGGFQVIEGALKGESETWSTPSLPVTFQTQSVQLCSLIHPSVMSCHRPEAIGPTHHGMNSPTPRAKAPLPLYCSVVSAVAMQSWHPSVECFIVTLNSQQQYVGTPGI